MSMAHSVSTHFITHIPQRRKQLGEVFQRESNFTIVTDELDLKNDQYTDLFIVDLAYLEASRPIFWMNMNVLYPRARKMAMIDTPLDEMVLQAALHGGAYFMAEWTDAPQRWLAVARAAAYGHDYLPSGAALVTMTRLFSKLSQPLPEVTIEKLHIDPANRRVTRGVQPIHLTNLEFKILWYLAQNAGRVVSYAELLQEIWLRPIKVSKANDPLKSIVWRLRQKIEPGLSQPCYLKSAHRGYFVPFQAVSISASPAFHQTISVVST